MNIKSIFNKIAQKREARKKYNALARAIKSRDLGGVKAALDAGADPGYMPGSSHKKKPLCQALKAGDARIFEALLNTEEGGMTAHFWHTDFRRLNNPADPGKQAYFLPSYLYAAIEEDKPAIAILLAKHALIDVERPGEILQPGSLRNLPPEDGLYALVKKPLALAREKGMEDVAQAIEDRLKPLQARRAAKEAEELAAAAKQKREEAARLLREAEELEARQKGVTPKPRHTPPERKTPGKPDTPDHKGFKL
ncbi:MAG: hypothetical protein GC185_02260 [Alphaproteobacteria bacterium]|nr:hypothetical protein [Alphaproteobacteria bacterium]